MDGLVAEVHQSIEPMKRPACIEWVALVTSVRSDGGIAGLERGKEQREVDHRADESAAPTHHELSVPFSRQEQLETDVGPDHAGDFAVGNRRGLHRD